MKKFYPALFLIFCSLQSFSQSPAEADPHRGMYIDLFLKLKPGNTVIDPVFSILSVDKNFDGIFEKEDAVLQYACENHITYIAMYDMGRIIGEGHSAWDENIHQYVDLEQHLCRFIEKAKSQYGITQIGIIGGSARLFDSLSTYLDRYPPTEAYHLPPSIKNSPYFNSTVEIVEKDDFDTDTERQSAEFLKFVLRVMDFNSCGTCALNIDVLNVEYEFWVNCAADFPNFMNIVDAMNSLKQIYNTAHPNDPLITEAYIALLSFCNGQLSLPSIARSLDGCSNCSPCTNCASPHPSTIDRVLYSVLAGNPAWFSFYEQNLFEDSLTTDSTDFHPMFYSEGMNTGGAVDYFGPWLRNLPSNTIFEAEQNYYREWINLSNSAFGQPRLNNVQAGGAHWFAATHMVGVLENPNVLLTTGPLCNSGAVTFRYFGPNEPGTNYNFYVVRDSDQVIVYPSGGTPVAGVSVSTFSNPSLKAINFSDTSLFPPCNLAPGRYTAHLDLTYNNGNGCSYAASTPVIIDTIPHIYVLGDSAFCQGGHAFLQVTPGYSYKWYCNGKMIQNNGNSTISVYEDGLYTCEILGGPCLGFTDTVRITMHPNPAAEIIATCLGGSSVNLKTNLLPVSSPITNISGPGGVTYNWSTGATTDQIVVAPTSKTTYRVLITDRYSGCSRYRTITVPVPLHTNTTATITVNAQPSSACAADGALTASTTSAGIYDPVNYLWSNGATTAAITGLSAGTYTVSLSVWKNACSAEASVTIGSPPANPPVVSPTITNTSCNNTHDGSILLSLSGGDAPFSFRWKGIPNENGYNTYAQDQLNLYSGSYTVEITDVNGCNYLYLFTVNSSQTSPISAQSSATAVTTCSGNQDGSASLTVSGGNPPYSISWNDSQQQTGISAINLSAGTYHVDITDQSGCILKYFVSVPALITPLILHPLDSSITSVTCHQSDDGALYACISGGTEPYLVNSPWQIDSDFVHIANLMAGIYNLTITDANGCILNQSFNIDSATLNMLSLDFPTTCIGCSNGALDVSVNGGIQPYTISWTPAVGTLVNNRIENLPAGVYSICVTDSNGCIVCIQDTVLDDPLYVNNISENSGTLEIFPNPVNESTIIVYRSSSGHTGRIRITDITGRIIYSEKISSNISMPLPEGTLTAGIYFVEIIFQNSIMARKRIVADL
jgi:hypothetical protein